MARVSWRSYAIQYFNTPLRTASYCNALLKNPKTQAMSSDSLGTVTPINNALQHTATHCNTLQCTDIMKKNRLCRQMAQGPWQLCATQHCNTKQHTATHCNALFQKWKTGYVRQPKDRETSMQHTATRYNALQCTDVKKNRRRCQMAHGPWRLCGQHTVKYTAVHWCFKKSNRLCRWMARGPWSYTQHTATPCNTHCNALISLKKKSYVVGWLGNRDTYAQHTITHCNNTLIF